MREKFGDLLDFLSEPVYVELQFSVLTFTLALGALAFLIVAAIV